MSDTKPAVRRQRVLDAINHKEPDQLPKDLGGMRSTSISCFAYSKLVQALGLPERLPRVHDTNQMLALPDTDVLDALDCDVVAVETDQLSSGLDEPERWHDYDLNGRLAARVMHPDDFEVEADGTITQSNGRRMPPSSVVFDAPHGGQDFDIAGETVYEDVDQLRDSLAAQVMPAEKAESVAAYCRRVRGETERAIMFAGISAGLGYRGGLPVWSMMCVTDPEHVHKVHEIITDHAVANAQILLPGIMDSVDVLMLNADDQGLQTGTILPPRLFRELYVPYYRKVNDAVKKLAPGVKTFLHCCGAIYDIIDDIVDSGFDILNPVQWSAGGRSYREWKDKARGRIALWGGGVNTQTTLPLGSVEDVRSEVREVVAYMKQDGGFVFNAIHNLLAEVSPEKVIALYQEAGRV